MRIDLSDRLVHLSKGVDADPANHRAEAGGNVLDMLAQGAIKGGTGMIKGGHKCVCFSEAPVAALAHLLAAGPQGGYKYQPYGIMVTKAWLYAQGGRPVIYGPDSDYAKLPPDMQYRHVRFELCRSPEVDHTWEREWRIKTNALSIPPKEVTVVVPNREAKDAFLSDGHKGWHYIALSDLGIEINPV